MFHKCMYNHLQAKEGQNLHAILYVTATLIFYLNLEHKLHTPNCNGSYSGEKGQKHRKENSNMNVFILSTQVGALGINLAFAEVVEHDRKTLGGQISKWKQNIDGKEWRATAWDVPCMQQQAVGLAAVWRSAVQTGKGGNRTEEFDGLLRNEITKNLLSQWTQHHQILIQ